MTDNSNREIRTITTLKASIELVWDAWTDTDLLTRWWGPKGFTSTIHNLELKEGGEWRLTLHGPDGTNYPNRSIFKEVVPSKKISFEHFNPHFFTTAIFEPKGKETVLTWIMEFETPEMRDIIVKAHNAEEGQRQNVERLEDLLAKLNEIASR